MAKLKDLSLSEKYSNMYLHDFDISTITHLMYMFRLDNY